MGANPGTSCNAGIPGNNRVRTYFDVMRNLHQVVDFDPVGNDGVIQGTAINAGIGADFNVIANDDRPQLLYFVPTACLLGKTETIGANHHPRVQQTTLPDTGPFADMDMRTQHGMGANHRTPLNNTLRANRCRWIHLCLRMHNGRAVNADRPSRRLLCLP